MHSNLVFDFVITKISGCSACTARVSTEETKDDAEICWEVLGIRVTAAYSNCLNWEAAANLLAVVAEQVLTN